MSKNIKDHVAEVAARALAKRATDAQQTDLFMADAVPPTVEEVLSH